MPLPLRGVRVVDLTSVVFGPLATQILGDLGADVIKIESPEGDSTRYTGPSRSPDMAALFMGANRNKRSVVLDLKTEGGRNALWRLIETADVFVHSMRPKKIEKLGFGYGAVRDRNKRIVYAGLHGYRDGGKYSGRPAYDDIIQGQSGVATLMAGVAGEPRYAPTIIADKTCALAAAYSINAALFQRERTGLGEFVEVPMFETMSAFVFTEHLFGHTFVPQEGPLGYSRVLDPWRRPYPTRDGYICMMAYTDTQWTKFWAAVGKPGLTVDPRFRTMGDRSRNIGDLYRIAGESLAACTTDDWLSIFEQNEIPAARIASLEDLFRDPHLASVNFFREVEHPTEGAIVLPDQPAKFGGMQAQMMRLQPRLGEHTLEVLREVGLSEGQIQELLDSGGVSGREHQGNLQHEGLEP